MSLAEWEALYLRAEKMCRAFFAEHFGDVCARCFEASEARADPSFCCCRRTNFLPEVLTDPLLGDIAEKSLGHSLMVLSGPHNAPGCAALGPTGCLIPFGRTEVCNSYTCEHLYRCAAPALPPGALYKIQEALEVFGTIRHPGRRARQELNACTAQVDELEALLDAASQHLRRAQGPFAIAKAETILDMFPPEDARPRRR